MKYLYKYPQAAFPYAQLVEENRRRTKSDAEYQLRDTGVFAEERYFDVFVEYSKGDVEDIFIKITVTNHGPESARLRLLPTIWFRNTWLWDQKEIRPNLRGVSGAIELNHRNFGKRWLYCDGSPELLFTENETTRRRHSTEEEVERALDSDAQNSREPPRLGFPRCRDCGIALVECLQNLGGSCIRRATVKHRVWRILNAQLNFLSDCVPPQQRCDNQGGIESCGNAPGGDQVAINDDARSNWYGAVVWQQIPGSPVRSGLAAAQNPCRTA
jgi:hypothetical protein